jgi:hypothetical protein
MKGSGALEPDIADSCNKLKERDGPAFYRDVKRSKKEHTNERQTRL